MARPAVQLYTLRNVDEPLDDLLRRVDDAGFEGVEYANRVRDADADAVRDALDETGLRSVAAHVGVDALESDLDETLAFYESLGCDRFVVPWLDADRFETQAAIEETADRLTALAERVEEQGSALAYHNHDHEFVDVDGESAYERFVAASSEPLELELDLGWATVGGADPADLLERWGDRTSLVHVSDADADGTPTEVGDGVLDVEGCAAAVRESGVEWAVYEHDEPTDPFASLDHGADVLGRF